MSVSSTGPQPVVVRDLSVSFRDALALSGVDLVAQPGRRIGLVGENGTGKSTLLRAVARRLPVTARISGTIEAPRGSDTVLLGQEPPFRDDRTIGEVLAATLRPLREAVARVERLAGDLHDDAGRAAYAAALEYAVDHDAWDADRRAEVAAQELGLGALDADRRIGTLSGGERTRLALATVMTTRPSCLLLDEPTNHLDDAAIEVLTAFLLDLPGVVLLSSHDRVLLDDVCTDLVDLDPTAFGTDGLGGRRFGGGWSDYVSAREDARRRWETAYETQQEEIGRLRAATRIGTSAIAHNRPPRDGDKFIYAFKGANVERTLSRRKRDAQRRLDTAEREQVRKPPRQLTFRSALAEDGAGGRVVQVRGLEVPGRLALDRLDVEAGEHLLVTGPNGSGKSTLLGVLTGRLVPTRGSVWVTGSVAELAQDVVFADMSRRVADVYADAVADLPDPVSLRELGLVHPRDHHRPVGLLSVGQRRRLGLAVAVAQAPDLMLLDEPTNHLSPALAGEIEEALEVSPGAVIVASHDRWLRRRWQGAVRALG
jgi:macrolide transport system ATP-binding/permease protein